MPEEPSCYGRFVIEPDHPCLPGHFPGDPIVPGVVLLDHTLALLQAAHPGQALQSLRNVRFRQPVRPAQGVVVRAGPGRPGELAFTGFHAGEVVLSGIVRLEATPKP
jgi:3-hydroxyacyl-[acyl-carrier-protein] dehydratase